MRPRTNSMICSAVFTYRRYDAIPRSPSLVGRCWGRSSVPGTCSRCKPHEAYDPSVTGAIFLLSGEELVEMREQAYNSDELLQTLLTNYPDLLAGDQLAGSPRRWLLVRREAGVPDREAGGDRWS